jgi:LPXTG-motif cell wall-anchored protein
MRALSHGATGSDPTLLLIGAGLAVGLILAGLLLWRRRVHGRA